MNDIGESVFKLASKLGAQFADVRVCRLTTSSVTINNGNTKTLTTGTESGFGVRVLVKGVWGFASGKIVEDKEIAAAMRSAVSIAKSTKSESRVKELNPPSIIGMGVSDSEILPMTVPLADKVALLKLLEGTARQYSKQVVSTTLTYSDVMLEEKVVNSVGTNTEQTVTRTRLHLSVVAAKNGNKQVLTKSLGRTAGFETIAALTPENFSIPTAERAVNLLDAKEPPAGKMDVIMDPSISGLFAHEACGHGSEADLVGGGYSVFKDLYGKKVAADFVNLYDDGSLEGCHGFYFYDSEGTPARRTTLIQDGKYVGYLHSLSTAARTGASPTGNARAFMHYNLPIVRMSNTFFGAGRAKLDDIVKDVKYGLLCRGLNWGYVYTERGQFTCNVQEGFIVRNGKVCEPVGNVSIGGLSTEILSNIVAASDTVDVTTPGMCGKGQWIWVASGGPHLLVKNMTVGGR